MNNKRNNSERGQALILIMLGFVTLLGFAALAIDGSMLYSDRRYAQNASDASSLAGGGEAALSLENDRVTSSNWNCSSSDINDAKAIARTKAIQRAADNGFTIDVDPSDDGISDDGSVTVDCNVVTSTFTKKYLDVTVNIVIDTQTSFAHFVYQGPMRNQVKAVTRVNPRQPVASGQAIVALNPVPCSGQSHGAGFHGTADVVVQGSGIFSNGCLRGDGGPVVIAEGDIMYAEEYNNNGNFTPAPSQVSDRISRDDFNIPLPDCSAGTTWGASQFESQSNLAAGLHCVIPDHKSKASFNGGTLSGSEVTIVLKDVELTINGNVEVDLSAENASDPAVDGLLIYAHATNSSFCNSVPDIILNGNGDSSFYGTIFAPCYDVDVLGTADMEAFQSQIIGWNVEFGGTGGGL